MTYEWAKPGAKVVCVQDILTTLCPHIYVNTVLTIAKVVIGTRVDTSGQLRPEYSKSVAVTFQEIDSGRFSYILEGYFKPLIDKRLPDSLTILLEKPNRLIVPSGDSYDRRDGGKWNIKPREKVKVR